MPLLAPDQGIVVAVRAPREAPAAGDPVTEVVLRDAAGNMHTTRIVGGPSRRGGRVFLAGVEVPREGAIAKLAPSAWRAAGAGRWTSAMQGTWPASAFPVPVTLALRAPRDLPGHGATAELALALAAWSAPSCSGFRALAVPQADVPPGDDGVNVVVWHDDAWPSELLPKVLAQTVLHTDGTGHLYDADVHVNGADYRWTVDEQTGSVDPRGVLTHEIGHALGLGHSADPIATMYASSEDGIAWRSLEKDDVDGVCSLYPGQGAGDCGSGAPCPSGYACIARACIAAGERYDVCSPCARVPGACRSAGDDARCIDLASGTVCGRACTSDPDCGAGFHCRATSAAGDLQCVADDGCKTGPDTCLVDANCPQPGAVCRDGVCVGPRPADAGARDAGDTGPVDGGPDGGAGELGPHGGCSSSGGPVDGSGVSVYLAVMLLGRRRARTGRSLARGGIWAALFAGLLTACTDDPPPREPVKTVPLAGEAACRAVVERMDSLAAHNEGPDPAVRQRPDGPPRPDRVTYFFDVRVKNPTASERWVVFPKHFLPDNKDVSPFGNGPVTKLSAKALGGRGRIVMVDGEGEGGFHAVLLPPGGRVLLHNVPIQAAWSIKHKTGKVDFVLAKNISVDGESLKTEIQGDLVSDGDGEGTYDADPKDELGVTKIFGTGKPEGPLDLDEECRAVGQAVLKNQEPE